MTETADTPVQPSEADDVPVVDSPGGEPVAEQADLSLTQELEAVVSRIDGDEPEVEAAPAIETVSEADKDEIEAPVQIPVAPVSNTAPWWPFVAYDVLWLIFAGALVWYFEQLPPGTAVFESPVYGLTIFVGVVLAALGPALILATWIGTWGRDGASKSALFFSALVRGSVATVLGVVLWWVALLVLDQLRLGRVL